MDIQAQTRRPVETDTIADMESDPGDAKKLSTVGRYVILDSIGMGGMGLVCAAYDPKLSRKIALKLLRNAANDEASTAGRNRLFREAQALAKLSHPNVVTVHDVDVFEGQVYIAMEFVEGTTLREWLRDGPRAWKEILQKFILAGRGVAAAHQADIIHRDFKPSNVLIGKEGDVRVADFGVAKERDRSQRDPDRDFAEFERRRRTMDTGGPLDSTAEDALIEEIQSNVSMELTVAGRMVGTPAYMAPEQHMGLRVGPHTDQYAFCVSLYEALYGRLPFQGADRREQLIKMTEGRLPPPPKDGAARSVPGWLHKVLVRGLRPHPSERWPSMEALLSALERDPVKRIRRLVIASVTVLGLAAGVAAAIVSLETRENPCLALGAEIEQHWNDGRSAAIALAFAESGKPFAEDSARTVLEALAGWAGQWRSTKVAICEATRVGGQSGELLDVRMYCLAQRAREFDAMVEVFGEADDEIIERSIPAVHTLGDPQACVSVRDTGEFRGRKLAPEVLAQIEELDAELDRAYALASLSKYDESLVIQAKVAARAREVSHPWTLARALFDLSKSQLETGEVEGGEASLREVIQLAAELNDAQQEFQGWNQLVFYLGSKHNRIAEGQGWSLAAESALVRAGSSDRLKINLAGSRAALALAGNDRKAGISYYSEAVALATGEYGEVHATTIRMMMNLGIALAQDEQFAEAEQVLLEVAARSKEIYGPTHPDVATLYANLGSVYIVSKQFKQAKPPLRKALEIRERIGGPAAPNLGKPLHAIGKVARELGQLDEALANLERATAILVKSQGENSVDVAGAVSDLGVTQHKLGRYDDARASFDRAQAIYNHIYPDGHRYIGGLMRWRCDLFIDAELYADAVAACELAIEIAERYGLNLDTRRDYYKLLVAAERGRGRKPAAARAQAQLEELEAQLAAQRAAKAKAGAKPVVDSADPGSTGPSPAANR